MLAADNWCVKVQGKVFGPYAFQQLERFVEEGRLAERSLIAPAGARDWREASDEPRLMALFQKTANERATRSGRFGRRVPGQDDAPADLAANTNTPAMTPTTASGPRRAELIGQRRGTARAEAAAVAEANFVIVFDVVSGAAGRVESGLRGLGAAFMIAENVWSVNCRLTSTGIRNVLSPYLRPYESLFVIDVTNGGATWQNYGPEIHAKITAAYMRHRAALSA